MPLNGRALAKYRRSALAWPSRAEGGRSRGAAGAQARAGAPPAPARTARMPSRQRPRPPARPGSAARPPSGRLRPRRSAGAAAHPGPSPRHGLVQPVLRHLTTGPGTGVGQLGPCPLVFARRRGHGADGGRRAAQLSAPRQRLRTSRCLRRTRHRSTSWIEAVRGRAAGRPGRWACPARLSASCRRREVARTSGV